MYIFTKTHPLKQRVEARYFSPYRSVGALSDMVRHTIPSHTIFINGEPIHADHYDRLIIESDEVLVCGVPGEFTLGSFLIALAVSATLSAATIGLTYLLRPGGPKAIGKDQQTQSITGVGNATDPFGAITEIFGTVRTYPKFPGNVQTQYTEVAGNVQYVRFFLLVGRGPLAMTRQNIKIGETSVENFQDVELEIREGLPTDPPLTLYTKDVKETGLSIALTEAAGWQTQTSELDANRLSVDWAFLRGLQHATKNGGRDARTVRVQIEYSLVGSGVWQGFNQAKVFNKTLLGAYPKQPLAGPILAKSDGSDTRTLSCVVEKTNGTQDTINLTLASTTLVQSSASDIVKILSASLSANDSNRTVSLYYYQQFTTTEEHPEGIYNDLVKIGILGSTFETTGKTSSVVRENHSWDVSPAGQYHVRMRRTTPPGNSVYDIDDVTWTAIRTIRNEAPFSEPNVACIAGRIRATDQLNGLLGNVSVEASRKCRTFDGVAWTDPVLTRNPAWAVAAILTQNKTGIGDSLVSESMLNAQSFKEFADWCTLNDFTFDYEFREFTNMEDAANLAAAAGRGSLEDIDGEYIIVIDRPQTVIRQHASPRNTWDVETTVTYPDPLHALRVKFKNAALNHVDDELLVYADGYTKDNAKIYELIEYIGLTNHAQVYKFARYEIARRLLVFEETSFSMDIEQKMVIRGDLMAFSYDALLVGKGWGYITSVQLSGSMVSEITIDSTVVMAAGKSYWVEIRVAATNATLQYQVINENATVSRIRFAGLSGGDQPAVGDLVTFGEWGKISQEVLIKAIRPLDENGYQAARLTVEPYIAGVYNADTEPIPPHTPIISIIDTPLNLRPPAPAIRSIRSDQDSATIQDNGSYQANLSILVDFATEFRPALVYIQAQYRLFIDYSVGVNPHPWVNSTLEEGQNGEIVLHNLDVMMIYEVRVRSINKLNSSLVSPWSRTAQHTVLGDTVPPDPPTGVTAVSNDRGAIVSWVNPTNIDFFVTEVWVGLINDGQEAIYYSESSGTSLPIDDLANGSTYYLFLRSRDQAGNPSPFHTAQNDGTPVMPASHVVIAKDSAILSNKSLNALEDVLTLVFTSTGKKMQATARIFIDDATLNSESGAQWTIEFRRNSTVIDSFSYPMNRTGPGSPGFFAFTVQDQPPPGVYTYKLVYGGSTETIEGRSLGIYVEELRN